jgi:hypothetical protein
MTGPLDRPRWRALEIGPGGVPPASVRPLDGDAPAGWVQPDLSRPHQNDLPPAWQQWSAGAAVPSPPRRRALRGPARKAAAVLAALCILIGLALWGNAARPLGGARGSQVAVGDCLASTGSQIDGAVSCGEAAADFLVVGRYPDTTDAGECSASPADLAVVQLGPTLLCLDYVATTGDCLLLGHQAGQVGKVPCGSGTAGEYRVRAVLKNSINADDCPAGTTQTLVHKYNSEVVCLSSS